MSARLDATLVLAALAAAAGCWVSDDIFPPIRGDESVETCPMPTLDLLFPHATPPWPNPPLPEAPSCARQPHDVIVVLGYPPAEDGTPSEVLRGRIRKALELSAAGYGDRFIVTGAAVHNAVVEAEVMRRMLVERGVPPEHVVVEERAEHTDENIYFSTSIMNDMGWKSALVVSDLSHLVFLATCDANCCVRRGRMTLLRFPTDGRTIAAGHYVLVPPAPEVSVSECRHLENPSKMMCTMLPSRRSCLGRERLDD